MILTSRIAIEKNLGNLEAASELEEELAPLLANVRRVAGGAYELCRGSAIAAARASAYWDVGVGGLSNGRPGRLSGFDDPALTFWTTYGLPIPYLVTEQSATRLVAQARYQTEVSEDVIVGGGAPNVDVKYDFGTIGVGLEHERENSRLSLQAALDRFDSNDPLRNGNRFRSAATGDFRLLEGVWGQLSFGYASGDIRASDDLFVTFAIRFRAPEQRSLVPQSTLVR